MRTMTRNRRALLVVPIAATAMSLTACGDAVKQADTGARFMTAVENTQGQQGVRTTTRLETTPEDVRALMDAALETKGDVSERMVVDAMVSILPKLSLVSEVHSSGKPVGEEKDPQKLDQRVSLRVGDPSVDFAKVGNDLYLHADVEGLGRETGLFTKAQTQMLLGSQTQEEGMAWMSDLIDGRWIGIPVDKAFTDEDIASWQEMSTDATKQQQFINRLQEELADDAKVTEGKKTDLGQEMRLEVPVREALRTVAAVSREVYPDSTEKAPTDKELKSIREDATFALDTVVDDDRVRRASFDLSQVWTWGDVEAMDAEARRSYEKLAKADIDMTVVADIEDIDGVSRPDDARMLTDEEVAALDH